LIAIAVAYCQSLKPLNLSEVADFYCITVDEDKCHGNEYDTLLAYEVFRKMLTRKRSQERVLGFLG
jgi:hypothetical protein